MTHAYQDFLSGTKILGVLGGGQLGRMLIQSAVDFNLSVRVLDPNPHAPCHAIATQFTVGSLTDFDAVYAFGQTCDLLTIEIENVNTEALKRLRDEGTPVYPEPEVIELIQDKRAQKQFYRQHGIPTADFVLTEARADLEQHVDRLPAVHKLGRAGYDGRGVQVLRTADDLSRGFDAPGVLEQLVDFDKEISVVVARNARGEVRTFPVVELAFHPEKNLVEYLFAPARLSEDLQQRADRLARTVVETLNMTGLLAVEMFVTPAGEILVNEVAPRTHNSGHHTIEANVTSQFEQHLRAILNLPLGATTLKTPAAMVNLLGEAGHEGPARYEGLDEVLATEGAHVHLYGKAVTKPFRKMGHVTLTASNPDDLPSRARWVQQTLTVVT
ncbi:MAG: 5-(carboxyamino)imidazole ribonucleotide synthase [Tunicatimonas sp.]